MIVDAGKLKSDLCVLACHGWGYWSSQHEWSTKCSTVILSSFYMSKVQTSLRYTLLDPVVLFWVCAMQGSVFCAFLS